MSLVGLSALAGVAFAACERGGPADEPVSTFDPSEPGGPGAGPSTNTPPDGGPGGPNGEPAARPYVHFDVNHVLSTGQSNAVALEGIPVLTTTQPFGNLMFDVGVMTAAGCDEGGCTIYEQPHGFLPLVEGDTFIWPSETMSSGLANEASRIARDLGVDAHHDVLVSLHGRSGNTYWCLRKGSCEFLDGNGYQKPFEEGMRQVADAFALAKAAGKSYVVRAVTAIHGESDHYMYQDGQVEYPLPGTDGRGDVIENYADALVEWQRDYEQGVKAITGQTTPVPLLINQYSHWNDGVPHSLITGWQLEAHVRDHGKVVIVAPTYALTYASDCLHFSNVSERRLGEYFAKAYARIVVEGRDWEPVRPKSVTLERNVITIRFFVPKPPLVIDTERVRDPGNFGFEYTDDSGAPPAITDVAVTAPDTVTVTLAAAPTGGDKHVTYAWTASAHGCPGPIEGPRGNLRDSDDTPSNYGNELFNWSVHFDEPIP